MSKTNSLVYDVSLIDSAGRRQTIVAPPGTHLEIIRRDNLVHKVYAVPNGETVDRHGYFREPYMGNYECLFSRFSR